MSFITFIKIFCWVYHMNRLVFRNFSDKWRGEVYKFSNFPFNIK